MADEVDYTTINATLLALEPIMKAHGTDVDSARQFVYYLLIITSTMAEYLGMNKEEFQAWANSAYEAGRKKPQQKTN